MAEPFDVHYRAFEDIFRGTGDLIKERLKVYMNYVDPLFAEEEDFSAVDLGSGRGEWLDLLSKKGVPFLTAVEPNGGMAEAIVGADIIIASSDALSHLKAAPERSVSLISAFHLVEHLENGYLIRLLAEAHRVLRPGGLLILETPNPENLTVASHSFWLDPTHVRPIPCGLLSFLVTQAGFVDRHILRLNGARPLPDLGPVGELIERVFMLSMDYGIVAQKQPEVNGFTISEIAPPGSAQSPTDWMELRLLAEKADGHANTIEQTLGAQRQLLQTLIERVDAQDRVISDLLSLSQIDRN